MLLKSNSWSFFDPFYFYFDCQNKNKTRENILVNRSYFVKKLVKMTRFARSKGSKASNERVEEEATPWEELKSTVAPPPSKKFKYNVEDIENDDLENFGEIDFTKNNENNSEQSSSDESDAEEEQETTNKFVLIEKPAADDDVLTSKKKRKRSQNKCLNCKQPGHLKRECPNLSEERRKELQDLVQMKVERKGEGKLKLVLSITNLIPKLEVCDQCPPGLCRPSRCIK